MLQIGPIGQNTILSQYKNEPCEARTMKKKTENSRNSKPEMFTQHNKIKIWDIFLYIIYAAFVYNPNSNPQGGRIHSYQISDKFDGVFSQDPPV